MWEFLNDFSNVLIQWIKICCGGWGGCLKLRKFGNYGFGGCWKFWKYQWDGPPPQQGALELIRGLTGLLCLLIPSQFLSPGELLGTIGGGVPPGSPNPNPISDQKIEFFICFQTRPRKSIPDFKKLFHHYLDWNRDKKDFLKSIPNWHINFLSFHPRRPRGSQSGREKRRDESFQVRAKEPLGTDSHRTISKNSSGCRLLIGHKNCFVLLCPIGELSFSWVLCKWKE